MKIESDKLVDIRLIRYGGVFFDGYNYFIKSDCIEDGKAVCVNLVNGSFCYFKPSDEVKPINAKAVIE